jgi:hypothetical protein
MPSEPPSKGGETWYQIMDINKEGLGHTRNEFAVSRDASSTSKKRDRLMERSRERTVLQKADKYRRIM